MDAKTYIEQVAAERGWTPETVISVLCGFIDELESLDTIPRYALNQFVQGKIADEDSMSKE